MLENHITLKFGRLSAKLILITIFFLIITFSSSYESIPKDNSNSIIIKGNNHIRYANIFNDEFFNESDTSSSRINKKEKSDWFYYVLGIMVLIAAGFILKQRYEQYLKQRNNLFH